MIPLFSLPEGVLIEVLGVGLDATGVALVVGLVVLAAIGAKFAVAMAFTFLRTVVLGFAVRHTFATILVSSGIGLEAFVPGGIRGALAAIFEFASGLV